MMYLIGIAFVLIVQISMAFPSFDAGKVKSIAKKTLQDKMQHQDKTRTSTDQLFTESAAIAHKTSAWDNGFVNLITRNEQTHNNVFNQFIKQQASSVEVCEDVSVSDTVNQSSCDAMQSSAKSAKKFVQSRHQQMVQAYVKKSIDDPTQITLSPMPTITHQYPSELLASKLREGAFKSTANSAMTLSKADQENLYHRLSNSAIDNFSPEAIKEINESPHQSYVLRKLAVFKAKEIYALLVNYKHQLQKEQVLAARLLVMNFAHNGL